MHILKNFICDKTVFFNKLLQEFILNQVSSYKCKKYNFSVFIEFFFYNRHNFQDTCGSCGTPPISNSPPPHHSHHKNFFWGGGTLCTPLTWQWLVKTQSGRPKDASCECHQDDLLKWIEGLSWEGSGMENCLKQLRRKREMLRQRNLRTKTRDTHRDRSH